MNVFIDTSSLFKLYHREAGTDELLHLFTTVGIATVFIAEITLIEFSSVVWKKCRKREISEAIALEFINKFKTDTAKSTLVPETSTTKTCAADLIGKHWKVGLRTLDSIQLASALTIKTEIDLFLTSDILLSQIAQSEGLIVQ